MIDEIHVENIALIKCADLVPGPGLTVLTGETGAGKTALLSALKLLMGERADSATVREGATVRLSRDVCSAALATRRASLSSVAWVPTVVPACVWTARLRACANCPSA